MPEVIYSEQQSINLTQLLEKESDKNVCFQSVVYRDRETQESPWETVQPEQDEELNQKTYKLTDSEDFDPNLAERVVRGTRAALQGTTVGLENPKVAVRIYQYVHGDGQGGISRKEYSYEVTIAGNGSPDDKRAVFDGISTLFVATKQFRNLLSDTANKRIVWGGSQGSSITQITDEQPISFFQRVLNVANVVLQGERVKFTDDDRSKLNKLFSRVRTAWQRNTSSINKTIKWGDSKAPILNQGTQPKSNKITWGDE